MFQDWNKMTPKDEIHETQFEQNSQYMKDENTEQNEISEDDEQPMYKPGERLRDKILRKTKKTKTEKKSIKNIDKLLQSKLSRQMKNLII